MKAREIIESMNKEQLADLILEYSDNGYFPLEPFLLEADYPFTTDELMEIWENAYKKAVRYEENRSSLGDDLLADTAGLCFDHAKKIENEEEQVSVMKKLARDLVKAREEDGIGMYTDSEWVYDEIGEVIQSWIKMRSEEESSNDR